MSSPGRYNLLFDYDHYLLVEFKTISMKVLAINGSPHMDEGNTAMILNPFLEGMKEAGSDVEVFYTRKLKIGALQWRLELLV